MADKKISDFATISNILDNVYVPLFDPNEVSPSLQNKKGSALQILTYISDNIDFPVDSVFGRTGAVTAQSGDYTAAQVTNAADKSSGTKQSFTAGLSATDYTVTGITGATSTVRCAGGTATGAPVTGTFSVGDYIATLDGSMYVATASGTPGTWVAVGSRNNLVTSVFGRTGAVVAATNDYTQNQITNLTTTSSPTFANVTATTKLEARAGWLAGVFGGSAGDRVVAGILNGVATIGAHNFALSAWANLYIAPEGLSSVGLGLSASGGQTVNARFHSSGSTILGIATSAVADASIYNSQVNIWYDQSNSQLVFKAKSSGGTVTSFPITATGGLDQFTKTAITGGFKYQATDAAINALGIQNTSGSKSGFFELDSSNILSWVDGSIKTILNGIKSRLSQTVDANNSNDDFVGLDSTPGANLFNVDVTTMKRPLTLKWVKGASQPQYKPASGQTIDGSSSTFTMTTIFTCIQFTPNPALSTDSSVTFVRGTIT